MHSIGEAAREVGKPEYWVRYLVKTRGLGQKVGWAIVLSDSDLKILRESAHGSEETVQDAATNHGVVQSGNQECHPTAQGEVPRV